MYMQPHHPHLSSELAREKQRDMIGPALWLAPARRTRDLTLVSRKAAWARWLLPRIRKRRRTAVLAPDLGPTRSEPETATVTSLR
jgi:hypothetical protein